MVKLGKLTKTTFFGWAHFWSADSPDRDTLRKFIREGQLTNLMKCFGRKGILLSSLKLSRKLPGEILVNLRNKTDDLM